MCSPIVSWWLLLLAITFFGALGGATRYLIDHSLGEKLKNGNGYHPSILIFCAVGCAAGLVVPLFLNASSSSVIDSVLKGDEQSLKNWFHLIGYCLLAGLVGNYFLTSMAAKAFRVSEEAKQSADQAKMVAVEAQQGAERAKTKAETGTRRALELVHPMNIITDERYEDAIPALEKIIADDPENAEALAWLAYCHRNKETPDYQAALKAIKAALDLEAQKPFTWLYNLACYLSLSDAPDSEIISALERAYAVGSDKQKRSLASDLQSERDFDTVRASEAFISLQTRIGKEL